MTCNVQDGTQQDDSQAPIPRMSIPVVAKTVLFNIMYVLPVPVPSPSLPHPLLSRPHTPHSSTPHPPTSLVSEPADTRPVLLPSSPPRLVIIPASFPENCSHTSRQPEHKEDDAINRLKTLKWKSKRKSKTKLTAGSNYSMFGSLRTRGEREKRERRKEGGDERVERQRE